MNIIIAGSRDFSDYELLKTTCDKYLLKLPDVTIVSGCAKGADKLAIKYADERGLKVLLMPADWSQGRSAGYKRNREMALVSQGLIAFWNKTSPGTKHMIDIAAELKLKTIVINY